MWAGAHFQTQPPWMAPCMSSIGDASCACDGASSAQPSELLAVTTRMPCSPAPPPAASGCNAAAGVAARNWPSALCPVPCTLVWHMLQRCSAVGGLTGDWVALRLVYEAQAACARYSMGWNRTSRAARAIHAAASACLLLCPALPFILKSWEGLGDMPVRHLRPHDEPVWILLCLHYPPLALTITYDNEVREHCKQSRKELKARFPFGAFRYPNTLASE